MYTVPSIHILKVASATLEPRIVSGTQVAVTQSYAKAEPNYRLRIMTTDDSKVLITLYDCADHRVCGGMRPRPESTGQQHHDGAHLSIQFESSLITRARDLVPDEALKKRRKRS